MLSRPSTSLRQLDHRDRPLADMASDRDPQTMEFIKPESVYCSGLTVSQHDRLADEFAFGMVKLAEDDRGSLFGSYHGGVPFCQILASITPLVQDK